MCDQYFIVEAKAAGMILAEIPLLVIALTLTQMLVSYNSIDIFEYNPKLY